MQERSIVRLRMVGGLRDEDDGIEGGRVDRRFVKQPGGRISTKVQRGHTGSGDATFTQAHRLGETGELRRILAGSEALGLEIPDDGADGDGDAGETHVGE